MDNEAIDRWRHSHTFGQQKRRPGESKTLIVIAITASMMIVEVAAGVLFGSMALLASHAAALSINAFAYVYARKHAHDASYSFGTGKVNTLGGFTGAILLACFAALMAYESVDRLIVPIPIAFNQAIFVAVVGLIVNGVSVFILEHRPPDSSQDGAHSHDDHHHHHHDHNLASAYLHVLADALTSLLAIFALLGAKYFGLSWMDPLMGIIGALLVARWSLGLLMTTGHVLLDREAPGEISQAIRDAIESDVDRIVDLHVWPVGPQIYAVILAVASTKPRTPDQYRQLLPRHPSVVHVTVEVNTGNP
jgi:cation diffusion facilitator family transporter